MDLIYQQDNWRLRLATPGDNEGLCQLFREVNMDSDLVLTEERDPDFFALRQLHSGNPYTVVVEDTSSQDPATYQVAGCCTVVIRHGWIKGELKKIGYVCDLRIADKFRKGRVFPQSIDIFTRFIMEQEPIDAFYFSIMRSNESAQHAKRLANATLITPYQMVNLQVLNKPLKLDRKVSQCQETDIDDLSNFLSLQASQRMFGFSINSAMLTERVQRWPDFDLQSFFIVRNDEGEIIACAAPWDNASTLRRSRVHGYNGSMKLIRKGIDLEARLRGHASLPKPGECFRLLSLTHFEVKDNDPYIMNQLLRGIYNHYTQSDYHFIAAFIPEGTALEQGLKGFRTQKVPMDLYAFTRDGSDLDIEKCQSDQPGFEMALH